uniref:Uncharacterized protein n=1 Tax=Mycena chlorophos TaxID=658473 RepID=A0ABQ0LBA9_MYCCL|nr:predicted protein [Mycena chlorophos]
MALYAVPGLLAERAPSVPPSSVVSNEHEGFRAHGAQFESARFEIAEHSPSVYWRVRVSEPNAKACLAEGMQTKSCMGWPPSNRLQICFAAMPVVERSPNPRGFIRSWSCDYSSESWRRGPPISLNNAYPGSLHNPPLVRTMLPVAFAPVEPEALRILPCVMAHSTSPFVPATRQIKQFAFAELDAARRETMTSVAGSPASPSAGTEVSASARVSGRAQVSAVESPSHHAARLPRTPSCVPTGAVVPQARSRGTRQCRDVCRALNSADCTNARRGSQSCPSIHDPHRRPSLQAPQTPRPFSRPVTSRDSHHGYTSFFTLLGGLFRPSFDAQ